MKSNRRKFLKNSIFTIGGGILGAQLPPVTELMKIMIKQFLNKASGIENTSKVNYLAFYLNGAPARWCFDQFLKTEANQSLVSNESVATNLTGESGSYSRPEYQTIDFMGLPVPMLWNSTILTANGGGRPMLDLLPHLINIRGYGSGVDGHQSNSSKQSNPVPSAGSICGHVADQSSLLFRALQFPSLGSWSSYNSIRSTGLTLLFDQGKNNYLKALLSPFTLQDSTNEINQINRNYKLYIEEVHKQIRFVASKKYSGLDPLSLDFENSVKTLSNGIEDLELSWNKLYSKYEYLILKNIKDRNVAGFSDRPIQASTNNYFKTTVNGKDLFPSLGSDLRDWLANVDCNNLISSFALAEFVITRGYGGAIEFGFLNPKNLQGYFGINGDLSTFDFIFDQHTTGVVPSTYINGMFFKAFSAGLLELIDQLKKASLFDKTFIHLVQEFGRSPMQDGSGSDHAFDGMISSVFTGINNSKPIVVGNISKSSNIFLPIYSGTFGAKESTIVDGESLFLTPAHVASTIAHLMQLPINPWANVAKPLIIRSNNSISPIASAEII